MIVATDKTVRDLAQEFPGAARVFEKFGIDYCCDGDRDLETACDSAKLSADQVLDALEAAEYAACLSAAMRDWKKESLSELAAHIQNTHHKYTRDEILRLTALFEKVVSVHDRKHPELHNMRSVFHGLAQELKLHMMKEERILFPYIVRIEEATIQKEPILPSPFGSVQNPVAMMEHEHEDAMEALRRLRELSTNFTPPADACASYRALYQALSEFAADLQQHIHLENDILFPRAVAMEGARR
jgi:regulator of cell morphogenesis and NO signaling